MRICHFQLWIFPSVNFVFVMADEFGFAVIPKSLNIYRKLEGKARYAVEKCPYTGCRLLDRLQRKSWEEVMEVMKKKGLTCRRGLFWSLL